MTTSTCVRVEELGDLLELPADDPRRRHVEGCPRCRTLLASYARFLTPGTPPAGARLEQAEVRLTQVLRGALHGSSAAPAGPPASPDRAPARAQGRPGFWEQLRELANAPALRPAWAAVAILVVASVAFSLLDIRGPGRREPVLRGGAPPARTQAVAKPGLLPVAPASGGALRLGWTRVPGAEDYEVRLYSADLAQLAALGPTADTTLVLRPQALPARPRPGETVLWRVYARRGGDEIAYSPVGMLRVP